jgi:hypothetical protein
MTALIAHVTVTSTAIVVVTVCGRVLSMRGRYLRGVTVVVVRLSMIVVLVAIAVVTTAVGVVGGW